MIAETRSNRKPPIGIDTHAHIFNQRLRFSQGVGGYAPDYDALLETFLDKLSCHDLSHAVLVQPSFLGCDNSYLLGSVAAFPHQLRAIVIVDPDVEIQTLRDMASQGATGVRLIVDRADHRSFSGPIWDRFAETLARLDWIVEIYCDAAKLRDICPAFLLHGCKLLIDHYGSPDPNVNTKDPGFRYLQGLARTGQVWVDTSGPYRSGKGELGMSLSRRYFAELTSSFGLERMVWGSDLPCVRFEPWANYASSVRFLEEVLPDDNHRRLVLCTTPATLFRFDQGGTVSWGLE